MYQKVKLNDKYEIDTDGVVVNTTTGKPMRGTSITLSNRYVKVHLDKFYALHLLVLNTFKGPRPSSKHTANHIDGNRYNNALSNLEWILHSDNVKHSRSTLLHRGQYGEEIGTSKLTESQARKVYSLKDTGLTARQIRDRLELPVSIAAVRAILRGDSWTTVLANAIPVKAEPTLVRDKLAVHNKIITEADSALLKANMHLLREHGGKMGLSIGQLLMKLDLTHLPKGTAYSYVRNLRLAMNDCND